MQISKIIHNISEKYRVIEYKIMGDGNKVSEVYYKVCYLDDDEYNEKFTELSDAISYINNLTFR